MRRVRIRVRRRAPLHRRLLRHPLLVLLGVPAALLVAAGVDAAASYAPAVQALREGRAAAQQAADLLRGASSHLDVATVDRAARLLDVAAADLGPHSAVLEDGLLGTIAAHLPWMGDEVTATRALRRAGQAAVAVGLDLAPIAHQLLAANGAGGDTALTRLVGVSASSGPQLARLHADLDTLDADVAAIPGGNLLAALADARSTMRRQATALDSALRPALGFAQALPAAIGPGRHSYLLLLSNPAEERPGGGFIGALGEVTFSDGRVVGAQFRVSDFANTSVRSLAAPRALDQYLFHGTPWQLSDANWSPDFPTSAAQVLDFWRLAGGDRPAGVIEIDPVALGGLLRALGPVTAPPYPQRVTADDTLLQLNRIVNEPGQPGKAFLAPFGAAMVGEVTHARAGQLPALAAALAEAIRGKHLLLHLDDAALQALVAGAGADGGLGPVQGDSLMVVDANLSAGKEDLFVQRRYALAARVAADGTVTDHLELTYSNRPPSDPRDAALVAAGGGAYRDYLRIEIPSSAVVDGLSLSRDGRATPLSPDSVEPEGGRKAVGVFVVVPRGATLTISLDEHSRTTGGPYRLTWDKQANALDWSVEVTVLDRSGRSQRWGGVLDTDHTWEYGS